jgi:hypothetical protein
LVRLCHLVCLSRRSVESRFARAKSLNKLASVRGAQSYSLSN